MQLERTQTGWLGIRGRFVVLAVVILAAAGITIPLMVRSGITSQAARPSSGAKASPPALVMTSFAGPLGRNCRLGRMERLSVPLVWCHRW